jgi:hypothetical protein
MNTTKFSGAAMAAAMILAPAPAYGGAGTTAGIILKETVSARAQSMGDAYTAVAEGPDAVTWNPAGLVRTAMRTVSVMYLKNVADTSFITLGYAQQYGPLAFGFCVENLSAGDLEVNYLNGTSRTVKGLDDYAVNLACGRAWGDLAAGVNVKYLQSTIAETQSARTASADVGVLYDVPLVKGVSVGASAQNLFGGLKYNDVEDPLPGQLRAGAVWDRPLGNDALLLAADIVKPRELSARYNAGIEYTCRGMLVLRAGYKFGYDIDGMTAGFGMTVDHYTLDYGFAMRGELGNNHRVSLSMEF